MGAEDVNGLVEKTRSQMLKTLEELAADPDSRSLNVQADGKLDKKSN